MTIKEKREELELKYDSDFEEEEDDCVNFFYGCLENGLDVWQADGYAHMNTMLGYDIGVESAMIIYERLHEMCIDIMDIQPTEADKEFIENISNDKHLQLDFSNWRTEPYKRYSYY